MTQASTPSPDRSGVKRYAAHVMHAAYDSKATTANGRAAFLDRFTREVDPQLILEPAERARRAGHAKRAYFIRLGLRSAKVRRQRRHERPAG